jgi:ER lumen protein retaining receptor
MCLGISLKTQALYAVVFITRYTNLSTYYISLYNSGGKVFFIASSFCILYLMRFRFPSVPLFSSHSRHINTIPSSAALTFPFSATLNSSLDTFRIEYLVFPCALLALIFNYQYTPQEVLWSFSIFLESVSILPQLSILLNSDDTDNVDIKLYLALLGTYRALYIPNWAYRWAMPSFFLCRC